LYIYAYNQLGRVGGEGTCAMRLFADVDVDNIFAYRLQRAKTEVESLDEKFLAQVDDESIALQILTSVRLNPLHFRFDKGYITTHEQMIPAEHHRHAHQRLFMEEGESYRRQIIQYHLPFDGDRDLLNCIPNPRIMWSIDIDVADKEITFEIVNWNDEPEAVRRETEHILGNIREQYEHLSKQVEAFNSSAQTEIVKLLSSRRTKLKRDRAFVAALGLPFKETKLSQPNATPHPRPTSGGPPLEPESEPTLSWDVFIAHASEDKEAFVRGLAGTLAAKDLKVCYDEFTLTLGDSLRRSIDYGLANSRFGLVVLSHNFFSKEWPQRELGGLAAKEISFGKIILPIWHGVTREDVASYSPILADLVAVSSDKGMEHVVKEILTAIERKTR
jgi:hypothetical protein